MSGVTRLLLCVAAAAFLLPAPASAQGAAVPVDEIDKIFSWVTPTSPGCAVAVAHQGKPVVSRAYGSADLERHRPITPDTVFDAGSVVKQFVAAATLLLVEEKRLSLTEDVRKYIPELPDYGHKITLDHLLTHTSGIRDWTGLGPLTGRRVDALTVTLRQRGLNFAPGDEWSYSNGGYVLLKEIVARTSGMSFGDFARKRLFDPLGMKATAYLADGRNLKDLALAYDKAGLGWKVDMLVDNARGGGGALFTTAGDLLIWNDALTRGRLGKFVTEALQQPATLRNGRQLGYARGLHLDSNRGGRVIWHSGGAAGYSSLVTRFPEQSLSIAIMCNAGEVAEGTAYARRIFDLFVPGARESSSANPPAAGAGGTPIAGLDLNGKAGLFFSEANGQPLRLAVENGRLRVANGPPLDPLTADRFRSARAVLNFMSQGQFELQFLSPSLIELKSMEGQRTRYRRAQPYSPSSADLEMFAGQWANDETTAVLALSPGKDGLLTRLNDLPPVEFRLVDRDTFQLGGMLLRFRRDKADKVVALDYSNPVVRNVEFIRRK